MHLAPIPAHPRIDSWVERPPASLTLATGRLPHRRTGRQHFPMSPLSPRALDRSFLWGPPLPTLPGRQEPAVAPSTAAQFIAGHLLSLPLHAALRTQHTSAAQPRRALSAVL